MLIINIIILIYVYIYDYYYYYHYSVYRSPAEAKSRFLKVGGLAWEFKIDTKTLEENENNDFEEGSHRRYEKNTDIARRCPEKKAFKLQGF